MIWVAAIVLTRVLEGMKHIALKLKALSLTVFTMKTNTLFQERNYPQVLCQQFVHSAYKCLFVTCTQESVILNLVDENIDLWNNLATIIFDTYEKEPLKKPTK